MNLWPAAIHCPKSQLQKISYHAFTIISHVWWLKNDMQVAYDVIISNIENGTGYGTLFSTKS